VSTKERRVERGERGGERRENQVKSGQAKSSRGAGVCTLYAYGDREGAGGNEGEGGVRVRVRVRVKGEGEGEG